MTFKCGKNCTDWLSYVKDVSHQMPWLRLMCANEKLDCWFSPHGAVAPFLVHRIAYVLAFLFCFSLIADLPKTSPVGLVNCVT